MSASAPIQALAETIINIGYGGEVIVALSTTSNDYSRPFLDAILEDVKPGIARELYLMSPLSDRAKRRNAAIEIRDFPIHILGTEFNVEISGKLGRYAIPADNIYLMVQTWLVASLYSCKCTEIEAKTGVTMDPQQLAPKMALMLVVGSGGLPVASGLN